MDRLRGILASALRNSPLTPDMPGLLFCAKPPSTAGDGGMLFRLVNTEYDLYRTEAPGYVSSGAFLPCCISLRSVFARNVR